MEDLTLLCQECKVEESLRESMCPVCLTQRLMKGKWKIVIVFLLKDQVLRFSQIKRSLPKVTQAYLSSQLKELEATGIIKRRSYNQVPPKVEYYLADEGKKFIEVIDSMQTWGKNYMQTMLGDN